MEKINRSTFLIIGGGIAGVSCAEHLTASCPEESVTLITATDLVKSVVNLREYGRHLQVFDVEAKPGSSLCSEKKKLRVVKAVIVSFDPQAHSVTTDEGQVFFYKKLCICTGGQPKVIDKDCPHVIGIRDTQSVQDFRTRLAKARRVMIVGNGGIALELAYELRGCEVIWAIKDNAIGNTFFDKGAASFFLPHLASGDSGDGCKCKQRLVKRMKYGIEEDKCECSGTSRPNGGALGPDWSSDLHLHGDASTRQVHVEYDCEVSGILSPGEISIQDNGLHTSFEDSLDWPVYVSLTNNRIYGCDFVVSATGVTPNVEPFLGCGGFELGEDGGIKVDKNMKTNIPDVYAAGDVCCASWEPSKFWFQMRLWSQARQMGAFAARCMDLHNKGEETDLDYCFELFAHVTQFFGYKVVLLGKYNAQGLGSDYQLLLRCTKEKEYIKVVMQNGRMVGAVLVGETDMEETFENLILNELDLSEFGESLLDPGVDIDDFFD
ncbi:predicted protein [Nematostella vectensis]|uniref:Pyridine nucleotide-disulfide oxidoreductase domain-containing protein 1 n=1 Tax=Nematostella vectensis TaxID=45351 RepID=A7RHE0_NEMVE|nr:predicted protein [Nematostella vectensis]|eukprot:XP_001641394.1 predicted protein [Nematostella vectensis]